MAKICYGKWGCWILPLGILLSLFAVISGEPAGFLSISCGGEDGHIDENNIRWVTDSDYIDVGEVEYIGDAIGYTYGSYMQYLRVFPRPHDKSCYRLPVAQLNAPFLLRLWFIVGNYTGFNQSRSFNYSIETVDMLAVQSIEVLKNGAYNERTLYTSDKMMYVCLIRTSESDDPFISGIELRPFLDGMYAQAKPGTMLLPIMRKDVGGKHHLLRYPQDNFDRIWRQNRNSTDVNLYRSVSSTEPAISVNNATDLPPPDVMQTAWVVNSSDGINFPLDSGSYQANKSLLLLYFAEIETLNTSEFRSFYVGINGEKRSKIITLVQNYSALELTFVSIEPRKSDYFTLWKADNSTHGPIINAYEYFLLIDRQPATHSQDIEALDAIKRSFDLKDWISDPCYSIPWKGIGCDNSPSGIRISEIDLSERNLNG